MCFRRMSFLVLFSLVLSACGYMPDCALDPQSGKLACAPVPATAATSDLEYAWPEPSREFAANFDPDSPFPLDPALQIGQLDNGFTYYIVPNDYPPDRALFTLVVDAGAIDEDEDQLGTAHFLEHMLFNGTENFTQEELRSYFEANGMTFGRHLNAGTSHDQTIYFLDVDAANDEVMETAFTVLSDWAAKALLTQEEVDKEKGVVEEEWRLRTENAYGRIQEQIMQTLLAGSRYAERNVIGDMDLIRDLQVETLRRFYEDWYRPELMTLLVIGSVESPWVEDRIKRQFASLQTAADARLPMQPPIPLKEETSIAVFRDPELPLVSLEVLQLADTEPIKILQDARRNLARDLALQMFNARLARLSRSPDSAFQAARLSRRPLGIGGVSLSSLNAQLAENSIAAGFTEVLTELQRAQRHGFDDSELHRAKLNLLESLERQFEALPTRHNRQIQGEILGHLLQDAPLSGIAHEFDLAKHYLPDIGLTEVDTAMHALLDVDRSLLLLTGPDKANLVLPGVDEIQGIVDQVAARTLNPYIDDLGAGARLLDALPQPVEFIREAYDARLDLTVLSYDNGVTALLKPTDLEENQILLEIVSKGGRSRVDDAAFFAARLVPRIASESGAGPHDFDALESLLTGQTVHLMPYLSETTEGYRGSAATDDLETLLQLAHLHITQPRFDEAPFRNVLDNQRVFLQNQALEPFYQLFRKIQSVLYGEATRERPMSLADLEAIEFRDAQEVHAARLQSLDSPLLILVGDFELAEAKRLISTYIGTLPLAFPAESWEDRTVEAAVGPLQEEIFFGQASQVVVIQTYVNDRLKELSREDHEALKGLSRILDIRYTQQLREDLGGTYSVSADIAVQRVPRPRANLSVFFATNERQAESLSAVSRNILRDILAHGVTAEEVATAKAQMLYDLENSQSTLRYWREVLWREFILGEGRLDRIDKGQELIEGITQEQINALAPLVLNVDKLIEVVQFPESSSPADGAE